MAGARSGPVRMAFSLITGFVEWLRHREPVKILILGLDGVSGCIPGGPWRWGHVVVVVGRLYRAASLAPP